MDEVVPKWLLRLSIPGVEPNSQRVATRILVRMDRRTLLMDLPSEPRHHAIVETR